MKMTVKKVSLINFHPTKDTSGISFMYLGPILFMYTTTTTTMNGDEEVDRWMEGEKPIKHMKYIYFAPAALLALLKLLHLPPLSHKQHNKQQAINLKYLSVRFLRNCCFSVYVLFAGLFTDGMEGNGGENAMQFHC